MPEALTILYIITGIYLASREKPSDHFWLQKFAFKVLLWPLFLLFKK